MQPTPAGLNLVGAEYVAGATITLTFDRAIDIAGLVGNQIVVDDGANTGVIWEAIGAATLLGPAIVRIGLTDLGGSSIADTVLDASAATGIVAVDDGGTWDGVTNLVLPFP